MLIPVKHATNPKRLIFLLARSRACQSDKLPCQTVSVLAYQHVPQPWSTREVLATSHPRAQGSHRNGLWEKVQICGSPDAESLQKIFRTRQASYLQLFVLVLKRKKEKSRIFLRRGIVVPIQEWPTCLSGSHCNEYRPILDCLGFSSLPRFSATFLHQAGIIRLLK